MTVNELIKQLSRYDGNMEVLFEHVEMPYDDKIRYDIDFVGKRDGQVLLVLEDWTEWRLCEEEVEDDC